MSAMTVSDTENGKDTTDDRFRTLHLLFTLGATPLTPIKGSRFYDICRVLLLLGSYLTPPLMIMGALHNLDDIPFIMEVARPLIAIFSVLWMHFFIRYKMQGVRDLLNIAKTFTWSDTPSSNRRTNAGLISRVQRLALRTHITVAVSHTSYLILRIVTKSKNTLFFNTWVPFDGESNVAYVLILIIQAFASWVYILMLVGPLSLYSALVAACCTQLEKIQTGLLNVRQGEEDSAWAMKSRLAECVKHHQKVFRFMVIMEDTFYVVLLGPFLSMAAGLCFTTYTIITMAGNYAEIIQVFLVVFAMMAELLIFCWLGNELTEQSGQVRKAAWSSNWVGAGVSLQRSLTIVMTVSKDFTLTAGKIIPVSRRTMLLVLNETYTYFMVLLNFVNKSSGDT